MGNIMNRFLYVALVTFITIACFTMYVNRDMGEISIAFADFYFQANFLVFGAAALSALFATLVLHKSYLLIKKLFNTIFTQRKQRLKQKSQLLLKQAFIDYNEARYQQAEKTLIKKIAYSDDPLLAYLTAAKAAQHQNAHDRRDDYIRKAHQLFPDNEMAIGITHAELQLQQGQNEQALATLQQLHKHSPYHPHLIQLLASTYRKLEDWDELDLLIPTLQKHSQLSEDEIFNYKIIVVQGKLNTIVNTLGYSEEVFSISDYWQKQDKVLRETPELVNHYAGCLIKLNAFVDAENVLREQLSMHWSESNIQLYSELNLNIDNKALENIESWLNDHKNNPYLLLALGKACQNMSLWGKARNYFEASISLHALPETHLRLARLLEENMDAHEDAASCYRLGLNLLVGNYEDVVRKNITINEDDSPKLQIVKK